VYWPQFAPISKTVIPGWSNFRKRYASIGSNKPPKYIWRGTVSVKSHFITEPSGKRVCIILVASLGAKRSTVE
jgi:hypothetical protein